VDHTEGEALNIRNLEYQNSIYNDHSLITNPHDFDEAISFDFGKSPNFIYIENLNDEAMKGKLIDVGYKMVECLVDIQFHYLNFFTNNLKCFFIFLILILFFHFFAGKFN
jgi:hypothetical protein